MHNRHDRAANRWISRDLGGRARQVVLTSAVILAAVIPVTPVRAQTAIPEHLLAPNRVAGRFAPTDLNFNWVNLYIASHIHKLTYTGTVGWADVDFVESQHRDEWQLRLSQVLRGVRSTAPSVLNPGGWSYNNLTFFEAAPDTEGFIISNDQYCLIAFRGSECKDYPLDGDWSGVQDWLLTDFVFGTVPFTNGSSVRVHEGFRQAELNVKPRIVDQLLTHHRFGPTSVVTRTTMVHGRPMTITHTVQNDTAMRGRPIWVIGHSLGGALATMTAFDLRQTTTLPVKGAYTFGAPMIGNNSFATAFTNSGLRLFRTVNNCDIVPMTPNVPARLTYIADRVCDALADNVPTARDLVPNEFQAIVGEGTLDWIDGGLNELRDLVRDICDFVLSLHDFPLPTNPNLGQYTHFATRQVYFDGHERAIMNAGVAQMNADVVETIRRGVEPAFNPLIPNLQQFGGCKGWWDCPGAVAGWSKVVLGEIGAAFTHLVSVDEDALIPQIAATTAQLVTDHNGDLYVRLVRQQLSNSDMIDLPEAPPDN